MTTEPALRCTQLVRAFDGVLALDHIDLEIEPSEFVAVLGPNSAGKTTLLNAVCGLIDLDAGSVHVHGQDVTRCSFPDRAKAGIVRSYEGGGIWDRVSVLDNVAAGGAGLSLADARGRARDLLDRFGLEGAAGRTARELSIGERRRMELARVLLQLQQHGTKSLVVLDEPFRGLDVGAQQELLGLFVRHLKGQAGVLMVEHNRRIAAALADRLLWVEGGRLGSELPAGVLDGDSGRQAPTVFSSGPAAPVLEVDSVHASYGNMEALHGVSLRCALGEALQLGGPNGCGKSSLLRVIAGSLEPTAGHVKIAGRVVSHGVERVSLGVGYVPQGGRLIGRMTVRHHLELAAAAARPKRSSDGAAGAFAKAVPLVEMLLDKQADELASGHRALAAIWVALATEPVILLADEPGAALAAELRDRVYSFLSNQWLNERRALLFVEHGASRPWARQVHLEAGSLVEASAG